MKQQNLNSMSMRQQLLFVLQMSQQQQQQDSQWNKAIADENQDANHNKLYEERRFKQRDEDLKHKAYRWRMLAHSLTMFTPIKKNKYLERNKAILHQNDYQSFTCSCQPNSHFARLSQASVDCGLQCLNNSVNQDCLPQVCPVGDRCRNRRFQLHQNAYVYPVKTAKKGWGLCAGEPISQGAFVMQYVGEVFYVDSEVGRQRQELYKHSTCTYMMRTDNGEVIDPTKFGNIARFMNHSCDPNCVTRKWTVFKETSVGIFAKRDIREDEELTFDYQFDSFKTPFSKCYCGTDKCKGYLGLGMYDDSDSDVEELRNANAPTCDICSKQIVDKKTLLLCAGKCRQVFHQACAQSKDKKINHNVAQGTFDSNNYFCRECSRKKADTNPKASKKTTEAPGQESHSEARLIDDPECKKFMDSTAQNLLLDKVIQREISYIEQKESETKLQGQGQQQSAYSRFYNFYFELCKRLNQRMKEDITKFKFRRSLSDLRAVGASSDKELKPHQRKRSSSGNGKKQIRKPGRQRVPKRPKTEQRHHLRLKSLTETAPEPLHETVPEQQAADLASEGEKAESVGQMSGVEIEVQAIVSEKLSSLAEEFEAEQQVVNSHLRKSEGSSNAVMSECSSERGPLEESEGAEGGEAELEDSLDGESKELSEDESAGSQIDCESVISAKDPSHQRLISQESSSERASEMSDDECLPKKLSLLDIEESVRELVENLWDLNQDSPAAVDSVYGYMRFPQQFNVYEQVFRIVVLHNLDIWECFSNVQFNWGEVWGGIVTLKMDSVLPMLRAVLNLLQTCTDLLMKNDLLLEQVPTSANLLAKIGSSAVLPVYTLPFLITKIWVPKNYVKKLIGYQQRTLIDLRKRFEVDFTFDGALVTDNVFNLDESHPIHIFGRGGDVVLVAQILQAELDKMSLRTICLHKDVSKYILDNIKEIKSLIDPCEIRVKRSPFLKEKQEIKHPFYTVPVTCQEICLIGNAEEIRAGEQKLFDFCEYRQDAPPVDLTTLSFLLPTSVKLDQIALRALLSNSLPQVALQIFEPTYPRKHLTLSLSGKWPDLKSTRHCLEKFFDEKFLRMNQPSFRSFSEFQTFTFHKQLRFCFKILKRVKSENDHRYLSYWDTTSHVVQEAILNEMLPAVARQQIKSSQRGLSPLKVQHTNQVKKRDYDSLVSYIRNFDVELCLNCMYVISTQHQRFEQFVKTLVKEDTLKEMNLPFLHQYLLSLNQQQRRAPEPHLATHSYSQFASKAAEEDHLCRSNDYHYAQQQQQATSTSRHSNKYIDESGHPQEHHNSHHHPRERTINFSGEATLNTSKAYNKHDYNPTPSLQRHSYSSGQSKPYVGSRGAEFHRPSSHPDYDSGHERYQHQQSGSVAVQRSNFSRKDDYGYPTRVRTQGNESTDLHKSPPTIVVGQHYNRLHQPSLPKRQQSRSNSYDRMHYSGGHHTRSEYPRKVIRSRSRSFERPRKYANHYDDRESVYFVDQQQHSSSRGRNESSRYDQPPLQHQSSYRAQRQQQYEPSGSGRTDDRYQSKDYYHQASSEHRGGSSGYPYREDHFHHYHQGSREYGSQHERGGGHPSRQSHERSEVIVIRQHQSSYVYQSTNEHHHHHYKEASHHHQASSSFSSRQQQWHGRSHLEQSLSPAPSRNQTHDRRYHHEGIEYASGSHHGHGGSHHVSKHGGGGGGAYGGERREETRNQESRHYVSLQSGGPKMGTRNFHGPSMMYGGDQN